MMWEYLSTIFCKNASSQMFYRILNTPLLITLSKICHNKGFLWIVYSRSRTESSIFDSVLIQEYMGQRKPVFWRISCSVIFNVSLFMQKCSIELIINCSALKVKFCFIGLFGKYGAVFKDQFLTIHIYQ